MVSLAEGKVVDGVHYSLENLLLPDQFKLMESLLNFHPQMEPLEVVLVVVEISTEMKLLVLQILLLSEEITDLQM